MLRRRRGRDDDAAPVDELDLPAAPDGADAAASPPVSRPEPQVLRPQGPWDAHDAPADDVARVDLGGMQVAVPPGLEMRVDVQDQQVVAATLVDGESALQLNAFAAPKSSGIWAEVRAEIAESIRESGGSAEEGSGPYGAELHAQVPGQTADQQTVVQPMRFLGVEGPRWFLRGLVIGPAATDPGRAQRLLEAFRHTVVVRGGDAMAPREMLPLRLPRDIAMPEPPEPPQRPGLEVLERGPEITEIG